MSAAHRLHSAAQALERLADLPGGNELLRVAQRREDVALVGGAVRDLLLGHWPRELDVTVADDAPGLARELAAAVSPSERAYGRLVEPLLHERFGTASVAWTYGQIDVATRRAELYPQPGALPEVRRGTVEEDLERRDFTVNAIMLALGGPARGELIAVGGALEDLAESRLRVLHERSFIDDPTRVLRLARYAARLHFQVDARTRELARAALADGALETVSGARVAAELWLAVRERDGRAALRELDALGVLDALGMPTPFDDVLAREAQALLPRDGSPEILLMGVALRPSADEGETAAASLQVMRRLDFSRAQLQALLPVASGVAGLAERLLAQTATGKPLLLFEESPEVVAVAGALAARRSGSVAAAVAEWFDTARHVQLAIDGSDLLAAGVPEGPEIGLRLARTLLLKREGRIAGKDEELQAALELDLRPARAIET